MKSYTLETGYIKEMDITVIFEHTFGENGDIVQDKIVGWYFGEPDDEMTEYYADGNVVATY